MKIATSVTSLGFPSIPPPAIEPRVGPETKTPCQKMPGAIGPSTSRTASPFRSCLFPPSGILIPGKSSRFIFTLRSDVDVWMDGRPHPPDYALSTYQGFSTGRWIDTATLEIQTDHLKEGFFTRNGVIRSSKAKVTTLVNRFGNILTITVIVDDPAYLTEPYIRSESWYYAPNQASQDAAARCEIPPEGGLIPAGKVPTFMPGKNETLHDYAIEYGLPSDSTLGGAETTYPEYIKKMKTMKTEPRTTTKHYRRYG